jgi:subfamily B ATP-binding cassette protein MsbA
MAFFLFKEQSGTIPSYMVFLLVLRRSTFAFGFFSDFRASLNSVAGPIKEVMKIFDDENKFILIDGAKDFKGLKHLIQLDNLSFSYPNGNRMLKGVTFSIEQGKMTAIVGPSGSGKTTIINLLMRFYDSPPKAIKFDSIDISEFTFDSFRRHTAIVSQEIELFNATIKMNLTYGLAGKVDEEKILDAVKKARLYDFINQLPNRFETVVGDRGVKLSGGEKQRLAIARAILKEADLLLLDEATSALDTRTEKLIQESLDELTKDKTTVVVAHRLSTIKNAHKIVVIEHGEVMEEGSLNELLERKGKFYQYWQEQKFY